MEVVKINRLSAGSLYKILTLGSIGTYIILGVILIIVSLSGFPLETSDGESYTVVKSVLISLGFVVMGIITSPLWAGVLWIGLWPGLRLYSILRPLNVWYIKQGNTDAS